jgi:MFS family permease
MSRLMMPFRRFLIGYATSLFGTAMAPVAIAFAALGRGVGASGLGLVLAAHIVPQVVLVLGAGVLADRVSRRLVMLGADALCCATQLCLAGALFFGHPGLWLLVATSALTGVGEAFFGPALSPLTAQMAPRDQLTDANAMLGLARSATRIAGPVAAGVLVAAAGPAVVILADAVSYAVSGLFLGTLRVPPLPVRTRTTILADLREGWSEFAGRSWLWVTTLQFTLFNLLAWAPFLTLGPVVSQQRLGGAFAWGAIMGGYGAGSVLGGLALLGRRPAYPLKVATITAFGWAAPLACLAAGLPLGVVVAGAMVAGVGSAVYLALWSTATQAQIPATALARVGAYSTLGSFGLGPLGLALAGPAAAALGLSTVLAAGAVWQVLSTAVVLALPAVRRLPGGEPLG